MILSQRGPDLSDSFQGLITLWLYVIDVNHVMVPYIHAIVSQTFHAVNSIFIILHITHYSCLSCYTFTHD